jgi:hypothetical protein
MRTLRTVLFLLVACSASSAWVAEAVAQQRDCQTIRTCNFARGGSYRGCLSSYSCRVCRFMAAPCRMDAGRRVCQEMRCTWG